MVNTFYDPGEHRAARVNALFTRIARRYDLINDLQSFGLHRHWKKRVLRLARVRPGVRALDLCCGTGDLALGLAASGANVVGLDFTESMLEVARTRAGRLAPEINRRLDFVRGDAQQIPFPAGSFEVVTVAYGLRNLADWQNGLREMQRVTRPGGRMLALDFGKPDNPSWRAVYYGYLKLFVPVLGRIFCGSADAYAYILESLMHYPAQRGVAEAMRGLGLQNVRALNLLGGVMSINYGEKSPAKPA